MSATGGMGPLYASMGVSAASSLVTGYAQSRAIRSKGAYDASIANTNAAMADLAGEQTIAAGDIAAGRKDLETQQKVGEQRAAQGASGVDVGSGSAAITRGATELVGNVDAMTIRNNASRRAFGYQVQGDQDRFQGKFAQLTAKSESDQTLLSGGLEAISGPLSMYANNLRWSKYLGGGATGKVPSTYGTPPMADSGDRV